MSPDVAVLVVVCILALWCAIQTAVARRAQTALIEERKKVAHYEKPLREPVFDELRRQLDGTHELLHTVGSNLPIHILTLSAREAIALEYWLTHRLTPTPGRQRAEYADLQSITRKVSRITQAVRKEPYLHE